MTSPLDLPVCDNGPHSAPADPAWQDRIWHRLDEGRLICGGCWTVGGITSTNTDYDKGDET